jgi:hypothetical protein
MLMSTGLATAYFLLGTFNDLVTFVGKHSILVQDDTHVPNHSPLCNACVLVGPYITAKPHVTNVVVTQEANSAAQAGFELAKESQPTLPKQGTTRVTRILMQTDIAEGVVVSAGWRQFAAASTGEQGNRAISLVPRQAPSLLATGWEWHHVRGRMAKENRDVQFLFAAIERSSVGKFLFANFPMAAMPDHILPRILV